jgi:hypothetical protein
MFDSFTAKELKKFLGDFKNHHTIRNYNKMSKAALVEQMDRLYLDVCPMMEGGTAKNAGFVRRLVAENKIILDKMKNPSKYLIDKYKVFYEPEPEPEPEYEYPSPPSPPRSPPPLFAEDEITDYYVGIHKAKKKKVPKGSPTEAQEDREKARREAEQRKELEHKDKLRETLTSLKNQIVEYKKKIGAEETAYQNALKSLKNMKGRKKEKVELEQKVIQKYRAMTKRIIDSYPLLFQYIKDNKLKNDFNKVYKYIRSQISRL